jgi:hypothetical protein
MKQVSPIALSCVLLMAVFISWTARPGRAANDLEFVWKQSLPLRSGDPRITAIGGTELRALAGFDNKLFAAIGYWMDKEKASPSLPGAQVLRLDDVNAQWQVDLELSDLLPSGVKKYMAISTLQKIRLVLDQRGQPRAHPLELLLAGVWKRDLGLDAFLRVEGPGFQRWSPTPIPGQENAPRHTQIRAFSSHQDQITGGEIIFAGATGAIFAGKYDAQRHNIDWNREPEWRGNGAADPSPMAVVASFAECGGKLYAAAHDSIYERADGASPAWTKVFETTIHLPSPRIVGLRGLTCIRDPSGTTNALLVGVEDHPSRIYRIDLRKIEPSGQYEATLELNVSSFLTEALGVKTTYAIVAYNNMPEYPGAARDCPVLLLGLESVAPQADVWFGEQHFNSHAYYLVRQCDGTYGLREVRDEQIKPQPQLVSVRTFAVTPFAADPPGTVYAGGFDANYNPVHNTAWLYKGTPVAR